MKIAILISFCLSVVVANAQTVNDRVHIMSINKIDCFYKYDNLGRRAELKRSDSKYYDVFIYKMDTIYKFKKFFNDSILKEIYVLNKNGLIEVLYDFSDLIPTITTLKYNKNNQLIYQYSENKNYHSHLNIFIKDGNSMKEVQNDTVFINSKFRCIKTVVSHTYSKDLNNLSKLNTGSWYYSNLNKNLLINTTYTIQTSDTCDKLPCLLLPENNSFQEFIYEYTYDENNRLYQMIETNTQSKEQNITKYFYY